jgi:hypothetical protein
MTGKLGTNIFISYRRSASSRLPAVRNWLVSDGLFKYSTIIKPDHARLALDHELLLPFEFLELMVAIWDEMQACDTFGILNSPDYLQSVWTNLELTGWRAIKPGGRAYSLELDPGGRYSYTPVSLEPMTKNERELWGIIRNRVRPFALLSSPKWSFPYRGSRLARKYYLLTCLVCGQHSLLPKGQVESRARTNGVMACAHPECRAPHQIRKSGSFNWVRSRRPILAVPVSSRRTESVLPLLASDLLSL